jgi:CRISPR-associated protein Cas1
MNNRVIDLSESGARLSLRLEQLVLERKGETPMTIPFADLAVLVVAHHDIEITQPALAALLRNRGVLIVCDERRLPAGLLLPFGGHHLQTARIIAQAGVRGPKKKRLWQQIVRAKLTNQAAALRALGRNVVGLPELARQVKSGDPSNIEAQGARRYWGALGLGEGFRRDQDADDVNRHLNYGYAVLRAFVARAICSAGLHPSLGVHHHNQFNPYCLADDLMEPFRPLIDHAVARNRGWFETQRELDRASKRELLEALTGKCETASGIRRIPDAIQLAASSLAMAIAGEVGEICLPERLFDVS